MLRYAAAFLASAVPGAAIQAVVVALWPKPGMGIFAHPASMFVAVCLIIYAFEAVFGGPALLLLRRHERIDPKAYALAGLGTIMVPVLLTLVWATTVAPVSLYAYLYNLLYFSVTGLLAGTVFWCIARPDRRAPLRDLEAIF